MKELHREIAQCINQFWFKICKNVNSQDIHSDVHIQLHNAKTQIIREVIEPSLDSLVSQVRTMIKEFPKDETETYSH